MENAIKKSDHFLIGVLFLSLFWLLASSENAYAAARTASVTGNWNSTATWGGSSVPVAGDTVTINTGITVTVTADAACASISYASPVSTVVNLTINASCTLDVSGSIATTAGQGSKFINVYGTLKAASISLIGASGCIPALRIYDGGTVTIAGDLTFSGSLTAWVQFPGSTSGTLNIAGNLGSGASVFSAGPGTINYNGSSAQTFAGYTYHIVKINNTAGVTPAAAPTITTLTIADVTSGSVFNDGAYTIATATTLNLNSGTYNCTAASFPWGTLNAGTGTLKFSMSGAQTVATKTYYNLSLSGSGNKTFSAATTISGNLDISGSAVALLPNSSTSTANTLTLASVGQVAGTWGGSGSSATNKNSTYFGSTTSGILSVATTPCTAGTWLGAVSTNWNTAGNWCNSTVPTSSTDVTIPSGTTYAPHIGSAGGECNNITINSGATLTMDGAYGLTVSGNWTNNGGTFTPSTSTVTFGGASQTIGGSGSTTFYNVSTSGSATISTGIATTISGNLSIGDGTTFTAAGYALSVTGTTTVGGGTNGSLVISSATGAKLFTGLVTIAAGGTWNNSGNSAIEFRGGITNNGTCTAGSGIQSFTTNSQALSGTFSIPSVTVTGVTLTNNNTLTVSTALSGTGGLTQAASATLNIGGTSGITTLTATNIGNTVNYSGAAQTIHSNNYYHLTLSGSGTNVLQTGTTAISGNLTLSGTVSTSAVVGLTIGGTVILGSGTAFTAGFYTHNVGGDWTNNGGTFTYGTGTLTFNGSGAQAIGGTAASQTFNHVILAKTAGTTLSVGGSTTALTLNNLTLTTGDFTAPATLTIGGGITLTAGTFTAGANTNVAGDWTNNGGTIKLGKGTVTLNGTAQAIGGSSASPFNDLTLAGSGTKTISSHTTISGSLSISSGTQAALATGTDYSVSHLYLNGIDQSGGTWGSSSSSAININDTYFASSTGYVTVLACVHGTWLGTTSSDWNTASNWCGGVPTPSTDVTIPDSGVTYWPTISAAGMACYSITFEGSSSRLNFTGGDLSVSGDVDFSSGIIVSSTAAATLSIGGTLTGPGTTFTPGTYLTVNFSGASQTIPQLAGNYYHLTLSGSGTDVLSASITTIEGNLTVGGTVTTTTAANVAITGNLSTGNGTSLTVGAYTLSVTGTTTVGGGSSGTLAFSSATNPTKTFTGLVTINAGASWTESGAITPTFTGGITNSGTFTAGTGVHTFSTNSQALSGTLSIPSVTVTGVTLTNNGTLSVTSALAGTGGLTNSATGTLNIGFTGTVGIATLAATASGNTVHYNYAGTQNVYPTTYYNLKFSGGAVKTIPAGTTTVNGTLTMANAGSNCTVTGTLNYGTNSTLYIDQDLSPDSPSVWTDFPGTGGVIINSGTVTPGQAKTVTYGLAINSGAKLNLGSYTHTAATLRLGGVDQVAGSWGSTASSATNKNDTYFTSTSTGIINVPSTCTAGTWWGTTSTDWHDAANWCGDVPTSSTDVIIAAGGYQPTIGAAAVCNSITISSGATLTVSGSNTLTVSGDWTNNDATFTPGTGTVTFDGTGGQSINGTAASQTFYNVVLSKTAGQTLSVGGSTTSLTLNNLTLATGNFTAPDTLTIGGGATLTAGTFTAGANINIAGDWTNNGATFTPGSGTVTFGGSSTQTLGGTSTTTFNNLTLNNAGGLTLGINSTVNGTLTFASGKITTSSYSLNLPTTASVSEASTSKYVYGNVQRAFTSGSPSFTFPIGDASLYDPVELTFSGISTPGNVTVSVTGSDSSNIASSLIDSTKSVNHCWTLANDTIVFTSYGVTFNYGNGSDVDGGAVSANFIAQNYTGGTWSTLTNSGTPSGTSASVSGVTAFGDFAIGDCKPPSLTVITSANPNPSAESGEVVTYTVQVTNSGAGPAVSVEVTNQLSRYVAWSLDGYGSGVPFNLTQGTPASGLTLGTPVYSADNGSTWTYTPVSGGGEAPAGYDGNVTNWKIPMAGTMNADGANFSIYYKARIK
ncbi:MAG: hypothetical protein ABFD81_07815 [Syntrophaceae bacterium]